MTATREVLERQCLLQEAILARQAERSLRSFIEQAWPILEPSTPFLPNWHIDFLVEHLEAVTRGQDTRLLINIPPRSGKSILVTVLWPVWEWIRDPSMRAIFASYAEPLAIKHSLDRRSVLQSPWYQRHWGHRVQLATDQNEKREFRNTRGGHMTVTSTGGSILGKGGSRIVVDDPHQPDESDTQREAVLRFFTQTLSTRLDNKNTGAMVAVMQRLHERDLSALCQDLGFTHVCIPAEAEAPTRYVFPLSGRVFDRPVGDILWPAREDADVLDEQRQLLGSAAYAGQYQQRPAPADGAIFQREWFKYYDELPPGLTGYAQSWDMAFKEGNDYVVGLVAARRGADIYLIDRAKGQWSFTESCKQVTRLNQRYPQARTILIEDAANGPAIIDHLKRMISGIIAVTPDGGKMARAHAAQPIVEAGNVYLPNPAPNGRRRPDRDWVEDFLHQLIIFPHGAHDDDVDAFTQLVVRWQQRRVSPGVW